MGFQRKLRQEILHEVTEPTELVSWGFFHRPYFDFVNGLELNGRFLAFKAIYLCADKKITDYCLFMNQKDEEPFDRAGFMQECRAMLAGRGQGIDLDTPSHWVIDGISERERFFRLLMYVLPADGVLYFEGTTCAPDVETFFQKHRAAKATDVIRDCIYPIPTTYHVVFSEEVITQLISWTATRPLDEIFHHIKGYGGGRLFFVFHDAFTGGSLCVSELVPQENVAYFCETLGVSKLLEPTKPRDLNVLRMLLKHMENPGGVKFLVKGESWWRRIWRRWTN